MSNVLFSRSYSEKYSIMPQGIVQDDDGNYVFAGRVFTSDLVSSAFAIKITPSGNVVWNNTYSEPFSEFFTALAKLKDGTFIGTGIYYYSQTAGDEYIWIVRLNADGKIIFQKALGGTGIQSQGVSVYPTKDGGYVVLANLIQKDKVKIAVLRYDASNTLLWQKNYDKGIGLSIIETLDDGLAIVGAIGLKEEAMSNIFILRLDSIGDELWYKVYTDYKIYALLNASIIENKVGHFVVAAKSVIMEVYSWGKVIWCKGNDNYSFSLVAQLNDNNYAVAGGVIIGSYDHAYITTLDNKGENVKCNNTELLYPSAFTGLIINKNGSMVTCGYAPSDSDKTQSIITIFE